MNNKGFINLSTLKTETKVKEWFFQKTLAEGQIENKEFWIVDETKSQQMGRIPLNQIVGTSHSNYQNLTWIEMLGNLKRFRQFEGSDQYTYLKKYKPTDIKFAKYGDKYFINGGNHRTTVAKFLGFEYIEAPVREYFFDSVYFNQIEELKELGLNPIINDEFVGGGCDIYLKEKRIHLSNNEKIEGWLHNYKKPKAMKRSFWSYF